MRTLHALFTAQVGALVIEDLPVDANAVLRVDSWTPKYTPLPEYEEKNGFLRPPIGPLSRSQQEHYCAGRMRALASYYAQCSASDNLQLVENRIVIGSHSVTLLALLQGEGSGASKASVLGKPVDEYTLKYCVTRVLVSPWHFPCSASRSISFAALSSLQ